MRTIILANPKAGSGNFLNNLNKRKIEFSTVFNSFDLKLSQKKNHIKEMTSQAILDGYERIVVLGGDGTLNEAVNGFFCNQAQQYSKALPFLIYFPQGTGIDFSRSIRLKDFTFKELIQNGSVRSIDVGRAVLFDKNKNEKVHYFINELSCGASALISSIVNQSSKQFGSKCSFFTGTIKGLFKWQDRKVKIIIDDSFEKEIMLNTIVIANGRYFGGGMKVAPDAYIDDGLFDIITIENISVLKFIKNSGKLYQGRHLEIPGIEKYNGSKVKIEILDGKYLPILLETDGETPGQLPFECSLINGGIKIHSIWEQAEALKTI